MLTNNNTSAANSPKDTASHEDDGSAFVRPVTAPLKLSDRDLTDMMSELDALPSGAEIEKQMRKALNKRVSWYKRPEIVVGAVGVLAVAGTAAAFSYKLKKVTAAATENPDVIDITED